MIDDATRPSRSAPQARSSRAPASSGAMYGYSRWWVLAAVGFALILFLCPFVLAFTNAIRTPEDYGTYGPLAFPRSFDLSALKTFWNRCRFHPKLINSTMISASTAVDRGADQPAQRLCVRHRPGQGRP